MTAVDAAAAAAGEMVNTSTSATMAADINEEQNRVGLSPTAGSVAASEGGALLAMRTCEFNDGDGDMGCD
jgi:hypothetical protein